MLGVCLKFFTYRPILMKYAAEEDPEMLKPNRYKAKFLTCAKLKITRRPTSTYSYPSLSLISPLPFPLNHTSLPATPLFSDILLHEIN